MKQRIIIRFKLIALLSFVLMTFFTASSQSLPSFSGNIEDLSDEQIKGYWERAKAQGYTIEQVKSMAMARGVSADKISEIERRINGFGAGETGLQGSQIDNVLGIDDSPPVGYVGNDISFNLSENPIFGYDFFNNKNITFAPNLNLPTPQNYQLGPGDEVVINIWGAAESSYILEVDRTGAIRIPSIGPVFVSGLAISNANEVIKNKLRNIYDGISAPDSSPYKVFVEINLAKVRTVQVNIIGEVKVPGTYSLSSLSNVLNALYASGGPTEQGTFRKIKLIRNGEEISYFDIYKYLIEGSQDGNKILQDQDLIVVSPFISRIVISGSIKRPGIYEILPEENLNDLFKYVSGFNSNAYRKRFLLERIEDDRRVVRELEYVNAANLKLQDGDRIVVNNIIDKYKNRVEIEGAVYRPGAYELTDELTLKDLIEKAAGLDEGAFMERGLIFRIKADGVSKEVLSYSVTDVMSGEKNLILRPNDVVRIYSAKSLKEEYTLTIDGAVQEPSTFAFIENMTLEDLIIMAGGYKDNANTNVIDVFRRIKDDNFDTLAESIQISADSSLSSRGSSFILKPNDKVSVRSLKGFTEQKRVSIEGEINFPGTYSIANKNERISDLVIRAGGLSPYAFINGATLIRQNPYYDDSQSSAVEAIDTENLPNKKLSNQKEFRVGINLQAVLDDDGYNSKSNLVLESGDRLVVPSIMETVKIDGEIIVPTLAAYDNNLTVNDYVGKSGGFSSKAKKGKVYVVYLNGDIASTKHFLFFRSYPKVKPGAVILVPAKGESRNPLNTQEVLALSASVLAIAVLVDNLVK